MATETGEGGKSENQIHAEDALRAFYTRDDYATPLDAEEIRKHPGVGWAHATAHNKLQELEEAGKLKARKVGSRGKVWWIPLRRESIGVEALPAESNPFPASPEQILEYLEEIGEEVPTGVEPPQLERAETILSAYTTLQNQEEIGVTSEEFNDKYKDQWKFVRPALSHLPGVESPPGRGGGRWHFVNPYGELARTLDREIDPWIYERVEVSSRVGEDTAERERSLIQLAFEHIKNKGSARRRELEDVLPSYYGHYEDFDGLWQYLLTPALEVCPEISRRSPGSPVFVYTGPNVNED